MTDAEFNRQRLAIRRVLRMTDRFLAKEKQSLLVTDGRGLMTWAEIRRHVRAAIDSDLLSAPKRTRQ
jgi:hypothetical protein